jgi:hypothetical protein
MSLDPNWFYSSLAQCSAAFVGLIGAILATKIQTSNANAIESSINLEKLLKAYMLKYINMCEALVDYRDYLSELKDKINEAKNIGANSISVNHEVTEGGGVSKYATPKIVEITDDMTSNIDYEIYAINRVLGICDSKKTIYSISDVIKINAIIGSIKK